MSSISGLFSPGEPGLSNDPPVLSRLELISRVIRNFISRVDRVPLNTAVFRVSNPVCIGVALSNADTAGRSAFSAGYMIQQEWAVPTIPEIFPSLLSRILPIGVANNLCNSEHVIRFGGSWLLKLS
jgi:hypothetical protein